MDCWHRSRAVAPRVAFGDFLPDTALSRRVEIRAAAGAAGGGCGPGSPEPGGLPRGTSAIQLGDLSGPLTRSRASRSRPRIASSICRHSDFSSSRIVPTSILFDPIQYNGFRAGGCSGHSCGEGWRILRISAGRSSMAAATTSAAVRVTRDLSQGRDTRHPFRQTFPSAYFLPETVTSIEPPPTAPLALMFGSIRKAASSRNTYTGAGRYADCIAGIPRGRRPASGEADAPSPGEALRRGGNPLCSGPLPALDIPRSLSKPKGKPRKHQDGPSSCPLGPSERWGFPTVLSCWGWGLSPRSARNMLHRANR